MLSPLAHLRLHSKLCNMDEVNAVTSAPNLDAQLCSDDEGVQEGVKSRVNGRGEEVTWFAYTKPQFTAITSAEEKHWKRIGRSTAPSAEGGASTGGTVEGAGSEGKGEGPFKKGAQNGLFKCSQCGGYIHNASHKWMPHRDLDGRGPCWYYCHATETGAVKRSASGDSSFSLTLSPS